jgi:hypothetical protein
MNDFERTIQGSKQIVNHIVVCGMHSSIVHFLRPLRAKYLKQCQYIVILSNKRPTDEEWEAISVFAKIIHIKGMFISFLHWKGSPLDIKDIMKTNITKASKAVILGHDVTSTTAFLVYTLIIL